MKFRKKPAATIDAEQWFPGKVVRGVMNGTPNKLCGCVLIGEEGTRPHVHTMHANQIVIVEPGDWIVIEPDGFHFYPIKPDIFAATYEPAE